jgi:tetratricopeptide (TPR) repeat protein
MNLGDKNGAIADYTKAIEINPQYAKAYYNRGIVKKDLGDKAMVPLRIIAKAIEVNPQDAEAYFNRATAIWTRWERNISLCRFAKSQGVRS